LRRRRLQDDKTHASDPTQGTGHAADAGTITTDSGKTVQHGELKYVIPPTSKIGQCKPEIQIPLEYRNKPCPDYKAKKWDGFLLKKAEQLAKTDDYQKIIDYAANTKLAAKWWGRALEQSEETSSDPTLPKYVYEIGLCSAKLWSQNLVNNKIIANAQITDYDDNIFNNCAKYDVLARSCLMGGPKIDKKNNGCYGYYAAMSVRVGEYTNMKGRRMPTTEAYDDTTNKTLKDGRVESTRKGKYYRQTAKKLETELASKVKCLDRVIKDEACYLFKYMMPAALQAEVQETTFLHKSVKKCKPCPPCPKCPGCPKCKRCECQRLTPWEKEAIHKVIVKANITDKEITTGVNCDLSVFKNLTDGISQEKEKSDELIALMQKKNTLRQRILEEEGDYYN